METTDAVLWMKLTSFLTCGPSQPAFPACPRPCPGPPCPRPSWSLRRREKKYKTKDKKKGRQWGKSLYTLSSVFFKRMAPTLRIHHDLSVRQVGQSALLLLAEEPPDGGLDAFLLGLFVQGVLAAGDAAERAGLGLQRGHDPGRTWGNVATQQFIKGHDDWIVNKVQKYVCCGSFQLRAEAPG